MESTILILSLSLLYYRNPGVLERAHMYGIVKKKALFGRFSEELKDSALDFDLCRRYCNDP